MILAGSSNSQLFTALNNALQQATIDVARGGNDWLGIGYFLQKMNKKNINVNGGTSLSSSNSASAPKNMFYRMSMTLMFFFSLSFVILIYFLYFLEQMAFTGVVGYDFSDMMTAFNGIISDFLVVQQQINNLGVTL